MTKTRASDEVSHAEVSHGEQQEHTPSVATESEPEAVSEAVATSEAAPEAILEAEEREAEELELE